MIRGWPCRNRETWPRASARPSSLKTELMPTFRIKGDTIELIKLLKATGLCSTGGMAKIVTAEGRVKVDDQTEMRKRCKIRKGQVVEFEGSVIEVV